MNIFRHGAVLALLLSLIFQPGCSGTEAIPKRLLGKWTTDDPEYRHTHFEITENTVMFGDREGGADIFPIIKIKRIKSENRDWKSLRILYRTKAGDRYGFSLSYHTSHPGLIKLKNPGDVSWMKTSESHRD